MNNKEDREWLSKLYTAWRISNLPTRCQEQTKSKMVALWSICTASGFGLFEHPKNVTLYCEAVVICDAFDNDWFVVGKRVLFVVLAFSKFPTLIFCCFLCRLDGKPPTMIEDSDFVRQKQVRDPFIVRPVVLLCFCRLFIRLCCTGD